MAIPQSRYWTLGDYSYLRVVALHFDYYRRLLMLIVVNYDCTEKCRSAAGLIVIVRTQVR